MYGSKDRKERLNTPNRGQFETTSQDFLYFALKILEDEVNRTKLKFSSHCIYAIVPLLSSAIKCLYLEAVYFRNSNPGDIYKIEFNSGNELYQIAMKINMSKEFLNKIRLFNEIRNEIIHPVHYGIKNSNNIPDYLKDLGIEKIIRDKTARPLLVKFREWTIIKWCFEVIEELAVQIIEKINGGDELFLRFKEGYGEYKTLLNGVK